MKKPTLHDLLVIAFEDCDDNGEALHGCYATAAKEVFRQWVNGRKQRAPRKQIIKESK